MIRALVRKELSEHGVGLALLWLCQLALVALFVLGTSGARAQKGPLDELAMVAWIGGVMVAAISGHMIVATEFTGRTQLFLESLPVRRSTVLTVKLLLMTVIVLAAQGMTLGGALFAAWPSVGPDFRFFAIAALRVGLQSVFLVALAFCLNLLGRYRMLALVFLVFMAAVLDVSTEFELARFGPFALVDGTLTTARHLLPKRALAECAGLSAALVAAGHLVAMTREGSVAALLAQRMSQREKGFLALTGLSLVLGLAILDQRRQPPPYQLESAVTREGDGVSVRMTSAKERESETRALVDRLHEELRELRSYLGAASLTPVFLLTGGTHAGDRFRRDQVKNASGVVVRVNPFTPDWNERRFTAFVVREVIAEQTLNRARREDLAWLLDGVGEYWAWRQDAGQGLAGRPELLLRALYGTPRGLHVADLRRWLSFRDEVGDDVAHAVAWSGLQVLATGYGPEAVQRVLRDVLARRLPRDGRGQWQAWMDPVDERFERALGQPLPAFVDVWGAELERERPARAGQLVALPRLSGRLQVVPVSAQSRRVGYQLHADPALPAGTRVELRWMPLAALASEIEENRLRTEDHVLPLPTGAAELPETFSRGERFAWSFVLREPTLDCEVVSGWVREEVR